MKNFWKIVMLTVLCVSLLCGVTAMAEADRFQFEKTNLTVFEGNTLELSLIRQGNCAADGELTFVSGRENIATVDENGVVTGLTKGQSTITATLKTEKRTWKASVTVTVARAVTDIAVNETSLTLYDAADPLISHLTGGADGRVLLLRKGKQVSIRATLSPNDANNRRYTVASSDTDVVRASGSTLTARGAGECIVTVASESNPEVSGGLPRHRHHPGNGRDGDGGHQDALHRHNGAADRDGEAGGCVHHGREVGEHERESRRCG